MPERLDRDGSLVYVRDRTGDDREPHRLTDHEITTAVLRRDGNLDLAAADLRDLLESRTGSDFGAAWTRKTDQLREKGEGEDDFVFGDYSEAAAQFGDVVTPAGELEPAGPPPLIMLSVLRTTQLTGPLNRYFRGEDFLNEPRTDYTVELPPTPSYEENTNAARRFIAVAVTYEFDRVTPVTADGEPWIHPGNVLPPNHITAFPADATTFAQFPRLSFTRDGRDFKIYPCQDTRGFVDPESFETRFLKFEPATAGS